jgi:predicted PurR-regulated permease PerM
MSNVIGSYFRGMMTATLIYMAVSAALMGLLGVPYGILLGILFGALYLIPFIGQLITYAVIFMVCFLAGKDQWLIFHFPSPMWFALLAILVQFLFDRSFDTFIVPRVVGKAVGLNPLVSMFVILCGGALFGLPGMMLAFPMAGAFKVILDRLLRAATIATSDLGLPAVPLRHRG